MMWLGRSSKNKTLLILITTLCLTIELNQKTEALSVSLSDVADVFDFTREVVHDILKAWDIVGPQVMEDKITPPILKSKEKKVISRMMSITQNIQFIEQKIISSTTTTIGNLKYDLPKVIRYELKLDDLLSKTAKIESADHSFQGTYTITEY